MNIHLKYIFSALKHSSAYNIWACSSARTHFIVVILSTLSIIMYFTKSLLVTSTALQEHIHSCTAGQVFSLLTFLFCFAARSYHIPEHSWHGGIYLFVDGFVFNHMHHQERLHLRFSPNLYESFRLQFMHYPAAIATLDYCRTNSLTIHLCMWIELNVHTIQLQNCTCSLNSQTGLNAHWSACADM